MPQREAREGERDDRGGDRTRRARRARDALLRGGRADRGRRARRPHLSRQDGAKDDRFERHGNDLHMIFRVDLVEALAGFDKAFTHFDGHEVRLKRLGITTRASWRRSPRRACPCSINTKSSGTSS